MGVIEPGRNFDGRLKRRQTDQLWRSRMGVLCHVVAICTRYRGTADSNCGSSCLVCSWLTRVLRRHEDQKRYQGVTSRLRWLGLQETGTLRVCSRFHQQLLHTCTRLHPTEVYA